MFKVQNIIFVSHSCVPSPRMLYFLPFLLINGVKKSENVSGTKLSVLLPFCEAFTRKIGDEF